MAPSMSAGVRFWFSLAFASTRVAAFDRETGAFFETLARLMAAVHERLDGEDALAESRAYFAVASSQSQKAAWTASMGPPPVTARST